MAVPKALIGEIRAGDCVAFVGAGFSAPVIPQWGELLIELASAPEVDEPTRQRVTRLVAGRRGRDLEAAAQTVRDSLGTEAFATALRSALAVDNMEARMARRLELLDGIPFRAVLTTNFDGLLAGATPGRDAYLRVLRPSGHRWWDSRYWTRSAGPDVVQLHGSAALAEDVVFTRQDYRRRLYATPGYVTFLRSVMATTTVLYLGFSFSDAYLDELRSEILALLEYRGTDQPIAYALLSDVSDDEIAYTRDHEGIEIIRYSGDNDHAEFDAVLEEIHAATNPQLLLGEVIGGSRIVWVDPDAASIDHGLRFLIDAAAGAGGGTTIDRYDDVDSALESIRTHGADLTLTRWGHGRAPGGAATAEYLLSEVRRRGLRTPVIIFASGDHADHNKRAAMALGAASFEYTWEGLFRAIERVLTPGSRQG